MAAPHVKLKSLFDLSKLLLHDAMECTKRGAVEHKAVRSTFFEVDIRDADSKRRMCFIDKVHPTVTVGELKALFNKAHPAMYPARICFKVDPRGRAIRDEEVLKTLPVATTAVLYMFDLGPQVDKTAAFLVKYTCVFIVYLLFYLRVYPVYTEDDVCSFSPHRVVHLACICHSFHYIKCLLEAVFVHRISRGTMRLTSMIIDCTCHSAFTAWMGFYINHPFYTPPSYRLTALGMMFFTVCELGSYFIHVSLRDLHTPGRSRFPYPVPGANPFTWPFALVSCPNYTYEVVAWFSFAVMTHTLAVWVFAVFAFVQMAVWARERHNTYVKEFPGYPRVRRALLPLLL